MFIDTEKLTLPILNNLFSRDVLAIRVKGFINSEIATNLSNNILTKGFEHYLNAPSIGRIGMAFYETEKNVSLIEKYFENAQKNIDELRNRCSPYLSPMDLLRCVLDETWPAGAQLETLYGKKMFVGLSRVVQPDVTFLAHHDIFSKDAPDCFSTHSLLMQFAANIYLQMPTSGGCLQLWEKELSPDDFDRLRSDSYGIPPSLLGTPSVEIKPEIGDLILFNSKCMHSVTPGSDKPRLSLSCFVGYRGNATPLSFWS